MNDMISYLKSFREETPTWLERYLHGDNYHLGISCPRGLRIIQGVDAMVL